jgi:hypothetical protein
MKPATLIHCAVLLAILVTCGCSGHKSAPASSPELTTGAYPVIYSLVSRTHTLTVTSGPDGPLYSVTDTKGSVLVPPSTLTQVALINAELHRWVNSAVAASASMSFD